MEAFAACDGSSVSLDVLDEDGGVRARLEGERNGSTIQARLDGVVPGQPFLPDVFSFDPGLDVIQPGSATTVRVEGTANSTSSSLRATCTGKCVNSPGRGK